jgi:enoyl-CoA hydratase/carnithine racemase
MTGSVLVDVADGLMVITLNRPEVRHAVNLQMAGEIAAAIDDLEARSDVRAAVLASSGPSFSAGMDLKANAVTGERPVVPGRGAFGITERPPAKPIIAAVEGTAFGGGFEIVLACDLVVASERASFGLPEVKRGLVAGAGGAVRLPRRLPRAIAMQMLLTGEPISASVAAAWGLVNEVVGEGEALTTAKQLAAQIAANAPLAVAASKQLVDSAPDWPSDEALQRQHSLVQPVRDSEDAAEGARAFVEKRPPVWRGR